MVYVVKVLNEEYKVAEYEYEDYREAEELANVLCRSANLLTVTIERRENMGVYYRVDDVEEEEEEEDNGDCDTCEYNQWCHFQPIKKAIEESKEADTFFNRYK